MRTLVVVLACCIYITATGCSDKKELPTSTSACTEKQVSEAATQNTTAIQDGFVFIKSPGPCLVINGGTIGSPAITVTCPNDGATILRVRTEKGDIFSIRADGSVEVTGTLYVNGKPIK